MALVINHQIVLDPNHKYFVDGEPRPGYSEIMNDLGFEKNPFWTDEGREEGTALALWINFLAQGKEPSEEPDDRIAGRVAGFRKFLSDTRFRLEAGEVPLYESRLRYCCTEDLAGYMGAFSWVIDVKRGAKMKTHAVQTAAQRLALADCGFKAQKRGSLYLRDGGYRLDEHTDSGDENRWKALVSAYHVKSHYNQ